MTCVKRPKIFGAGLIALDLVIGLDANAPVRSWAGEPAAMCCRSWRTLAGTLTRLRG
jgi:hypothetical protein